MEKQGVPMNQYPQSQDMSYQQQQPQQQPPVYHQTGDPQFQQQQQQQIYAQQPGTPQPQKHDLAGSPPPQQQQQFQTPGMPPQQHQQQQQPITYQNATPIASLNRGPAPADCPACGQRSMTSVAYETGNTTHAWALGLCCLTCLGCIPYLVNSLKDVLHRCGRCGVLLATWHRSGTTEVHIHS